MAALAPAPVLPAAAALVPSSSDAAAAPSTDEAAPVELTGRIDPVPMDGNCLFTSAFRELARLRRAGSVASPAELRAAIVEWVRIKGSETECAELTLAQWISLETEEELEQYIARMRRNGEWGGIIELYALTEMFDVCTCVYEPGAVTSTGRRAHVRRHALEAGNRPEGAPPPPRAHLHYNGTSHYSIFVPDEGQLVDEPRAVAAAAAVATAPGAGGKVSTASRAAVASSRNSSRARSSSSGGSSSSGSSSSGSGGSASAAEGAASKRPIKSARTPLGSSSERTLGSSGTSRGGSSSNRPVPAAAKKKAATVQAAAPALGGLPVLAASRGGTLPPASSARRRATLGAMRTGGQPWMSSAFGGRNSLPREVRV